MLSRGRGASRGFRGSKGDGKVTFAENAALCRRRGRHLAIGSGRLDLDGNLQVCVIVDDNCRVSYASSTGSDMNKVDDSTLSLPEKLELAREVLHDFHAQCFWYMREDIEPKPEDLDEIVRSLRQNGGRRGFLLAAKLCR
jgi:hypothetical protein